VRAEWVSRQAGGKKLTDGVQRGAKSTSNGRGWMEGDGRAVRALEWVVHLSEGLGRRFGIALPLCRSSLRSSPGCRSAPRAPWGGPGLPTETMVVWKAGVAALVKDFDLRSGADKSNALGIR
jgi:hypothetical protein